MNQPLPPDDPKVRRPDIAVAKRELGWSPTVALDDGLLPTIDYFKQQSAGAAEVYPPPVDFAVS